MADTMNARQVRILHATATLLEREGVLMYVDRVGPLTPEGLVEELRHNLDQLGTFVDLSLVAYDLTVSRQMMVSEMLQDPVELLRIMLSLREHFVAYPGLESLS